MLGTFAALHYAQLRLTLAHYDAKAHLVVSRRILDSLTPGWEQVGAVWLPLPHLLQMFPVQIDWFYRTGLVAVAVSIVCHALTVGALAATVLMLTGSRSGAVVAALLFAVNPNALYLQSTPMTEPMLFGLTAWQVCLTAAWVRRERLEVPRGLGWVTVAACLTRYEAWPITAACFMVSAWCWRRRRQSSANLRRVYSQLAVYPAAAVLGFMLFSRITVGEWFVTSGFFVPDDTLRGQPGHVIDVILQGAGALSTSWLIQLALIAALLVTLLGLLSPARAHLLVALCLFGAAALPISAYLAGHPFRIRYQMALVLAGCLTVGTAIGLTRRLAPLAAAVVLGLAVRDIRPVDPAAPMVREAQLDPNVQPRAQVTACLRERYRGGPIMASMGSLGHYMHEMSAAGFGIADFLHEGNGLLWDSAFTRGPAPLVEWVLVEEIAEGGDAIAQRARQVPALLAPFDRVCAGGGVALYKRKATG